MRKLAALIACLMVSIAGTAEVKSNVRAWKAEAGSVARLGVSDAGCEVARLMIKMMGLSYHSGLFNWQGVQFIAVKETSDSVAVRGNGHVVVAIIVK